MEKSKFTVREQERKVLLSLILNLKQGQGPFLYGSGAENSLYIF